MRRRRDDDLPALEALLAEQQPASRYPWRWPLPFPVREFLVRDAEQASWVCEVDGVLAGHVAVSAAGDDEAATVFRTATGCADPAVVSVLVVATAARGRGVAGALLDTAVAWAHAAGRVPVLDVLPVHSAAHAVYVHRGWVDLGGARFSWLPDELPDVRLMALPPYPLP